MSQKTNRKPGRPPSPKPKNARMQFVVEEEAAERYHKAAFAEGMLFSEWVRALCDQRVKEVLNKE